MKSVKFYLFCLFSITLLALGIFIMVLFNSEPENSDIIVKGTFFSSLFVFFCGILTFIGFYLRVARSNNKMFFSNFIPSLRQATLFSLLIISLLILRSLKLLNWWDVIMLTLCLMLFEMFFQTRSQNILSKKN